MLIYLSLINTASAETTEAVFGQLKPYAQMQLWTTLYDMDESQTADPAGYGDPEDDFGFKLRRIRIGAKSEGKILGYTVSIGLSSPYDSTIHHGNSELGLVDAFVDCKASKGFTFRAGLQRTPVSRENMTSSGDLALTDRTVPTVWLVPDRDIGLSATYFAGSPSGFRSRIIAGIFNGEHLLTGDESPGKLSTVRAEIMNGKASTYETFGSVESVTFGFGGDFFHNAERATTTMGYGVDAILRIKGLSALAEFRMNQIEPTNTEIDNPDVLSKTNRMGYSAQLGYTFNTIESVVRYSSFDDNMDSDTSGDIANVEAGLTWHGSNDHIQIGLGYIMRLENSGNSVDNDTARLWVQMKH